MESEQAGLKLKAEEERKLAMSQVADGFEQAIGKIIEAVSSASSEIELAAGSLTRTAETNHKHTAEAASASDRSSANAQSAAAASEQMASSVTEIGRQVKQSEDITHAAVRQAEQTNERIAELSQAAGRIGEVVKLIAAVAEQTNLLALNATIEAARAGEAGRGFAVVASEVKALAAQTAKATEEIGAQITQMQSATEQSVSAIKAIGGDDRADLRDFNGDCRGGRTAGRRDAGDCAQRPASRRGCHRGRRLPRRCQPRFGRHPGGGRTGPWFCPFALAGRPFPQTRGREIPADDTRGLKNREWRME